MSFQFTFSHGGENYEVSGTYGHGENQAFVVTKLLPGAKRMFGTAGQRSGIKIEKALSVDSAEELVAELRKTYPGLTDFKQA